MKLVVLALTAVIASTSTLPKDVTCEECVASVDSLVAKFTTDESIAEQVDFLIEKLCWMSTDIEQCKWGMTNLWPEISKALYPEFLPGKETCTNLFNVCTAAVREWTCDECLEGVIGVSDYMMDPVVMDKMIVFLQGDAFCGNHDMQEHCKEAVIELIPAAMPLLSELLFDDSVSICQGINGVC